MKSLRPTLKKASNFAYDDDILIKMMFSAKNNMWHFLLLPMTMELSIADIICIDSDLETMQDVEKPEGFDGTLDLSVMVN